MPTTFSGRPGEKPSAIDPAIRSITRRTSASSYCVRMRRGEGSQNSTEKQTAARLLCLLEHRFVFLAIPRHVASRVLITGSAVENERGASTDSWLWLKSLARVVLMPYK